MPLPIYSNVWPMIQLVACLVIIWRLLMFRRGASRHRHGVAWLAWLLLVACTMTAVKLLFGVRPPPGPPEAIITLLIAIHVLAHRGNLAHLVRWPRAFLLWLWRRDFR
jgi:hypothetical protein